MIPLILNSALYFITMFSPFGTDKKESLSPGLDDAIATVAEDSHVEKTHQDLPPSKVYFFWQRSFIRYSTTV